MQRKIPRNIRQIGYANENEKVYLEDYVDTYLNQLGEKAEQNPMGAFLIGEQFQEDGRKQTYLFGAVQMKEIKEQGGKIRIPEESFRQAQRECGEYFENGSILGWFVAVNGYSSGIDSHMIREHEKYLAQPDTFLLIQDPGSQEENFYVYRKQDFERLSGHYIYYEKNPSMQNYMIDQRKGVGIEPQGIVPDAAAQNFRQILQEKEAKKSSRNMQKLSYTFSAGLVLIVLVMGIAAFNNYDGLTGMRSAIRASSSDVTAESTSGKEASGTSGQEDSAETQDTDGSAEDQNKDEQASGDSAGQASGNNAGQASGDSAGDGQASGNNAGDGQAQEQAAAGKNSTDESQSQQEKTEKQEQPASQTQPKNYYVVKRGDTLVSISRKMYGDTSKVKEICNLNDITNVNLIIEGQKILLP